MAVDITIPLLSEEDALRRIVAHIRSGRRTSDPLGAPDHGHDVYVPYLVGMLGTEAQQAHRSANPGGMITYRQDLRKNSGPFYNAAWSLVQRGILSPAPTFPPANGNPIAEVIGGAFSVTAYGRKWLSGLEEHVCLPSEYSRFAQLLAGHSSRFGNGYRSRSQEALSCYEGKTYLACCVMCGAAAESILLALAIERKGDEEAVLADYRTGSGRSRIEKLVLAQQNAHIMRELPNFTSLMNYWRDESAHGLSTPI